MHKNVIAYSNTYGCYLPVTRVTCPVCYTYFSMHTTCICPYCNMHIVYSHVLHMTITFMLQECSGKHACMSHAWDYRIHLV